jgi:hypothetical protein
MGNPCCTTCVALGFEATENAWWHKAAKETNPPVVHPKVHPFKEESNTEFMKRIQSKADGPETPRTK